MADVIKYRFRCRRRTAAEWTSVNEILLAQEIGLEEDTGLGKIGDGSTAWNDLLYTIVGEVDLTGLADGKCLAWDATAGHWYVTDRGKAYAAGDGIHIDDTDPDAPVISSTLGSIALDGRVDTYADLPTGLGAGDDGNAYLVDEDSLVYVWNGSAFPSEGGGISTQGAASAWKPVYRTANGTSSVQTTAITIRTVLSRLTDFKFDPYGLSSTWSADIACFLSGISAVDVDVWAGIAKTSTQGYPIDFKNPPVQLTYNGDGAINIPANAQILLDKFTLDDLDVTDKIVIAVYFKAAATLQSYSSSSSYAYGALNAYYKADPSGAGSDAATQNTAGYSAATNPSYGVSQLGLLSH